MSRLKHTLCAAALTLPLLASPVAHAEEFSLHRFKPAVHSLGAFTTEAARVSHGLTLNAFLFTSVAGPLLQDESGADLVDSYVSSSLVASIGLLDHVSAGVEVPFHVASGTFLDGQDTSGFGTGDIRLSVKAAALKPLRIGPGLGLQFDIVLPTGGEGAYSREREVMFVPRLVMDAITEGAHVMANLWVSARSSTISANALARTHAPANSGVTFSDDFLVGTEIGMSAAVAVFLGSPDLRMIFEGRFESLAERYFEPSASALEFTWGMHWRHQSGMAVGGGASFGALEGAGDPDWRAFLSVGYQPAALIPVDGPVRDTDGDGIPDAKDMCPADPEDMDGFQDEDGCPEYDNDGDGIPDHRDACPNDAEDMDGDRDDDGCPDADRDRDGIADDLDKCPDQPEDIDLFEDEDGCPDPDNDGDGILDVNDKCPLQPEDFDGDRDDDGCPDGDADKDGIPDDMDKCPQQPEDVDGFEDEDGCPDPDNDGDGILDVNDKCPLQPEDVDGYKDEDGCPDPDNDGDGILDVNDKCPLMPEDFDGCEDEDGCPEEGKVCVSKEKINITEKIFFKTGKADILPKSYALLAELAQVINANPHVELIEIQGHTDSQGSAAFNRTLSENRANSVLMHLVNVGRVDASRLSSKGFGPDMPIGDNRKAAGRELNRRVEFIIMRQKTD